MSPARTGFFSVSRAFLEQWSQFLSPPQWAVWLILASDSDKCGTSWCSGRTIATRLGMSRSAVGHALRALECFRLIEREVRSKRGPVQTWQYRLKGQNVRTPKTKPRQLKASLRYRNKITSDINRPLGDTCLWLSMKKSKVDTRRSWATLTRNRAASGQLRRHW